MAENLLNPSIDKVYPEFIELYLKYSNEHAHQFEKFTNNFIEPHNYLVGSNLLQSYKNLGGCVTSFRKGEHQKLVSEYIKLGGDITQFNEDGSKKIKNMLFSMSHV